MTEAVATEKKFRGTLTFDVDKEGMEKVYEAAKLLGGAGIEFDTGACSDEDGRYHLDWELDWSLKGVILHRVEEVDSQ
jgi:hypothetical protein